MYQVREQGVTILSKILYSAKQSSTKPSQCHLNQVLSLCYRKQRRNSTPLQDGLRPRTLNTRKQVISISRQLTLSNSKNSSANLATVSPKRPSAEKSVMKSTMQRMLGGFQRRVTRTAIQTVRSVLSPPLPVMLTSHSSSRYHCSWTDSDLPYSRGSFSASSRSRERDRSNLP